MHEARIEVRDSGGGLEIRLIDVTAGEVELARSAAGDGFVQGFPDLLRANGQRVTAADLEDTYQKDAGLNGTLFGRYLYRLLTPGGIAQKWEKLKEACGDEDETLTTLLELHPPDWQKLPWELLYKDLYLFQDRQHSIGLRIPGGSAKKASCRWPLRMLILVGCGEDDEKIRWEEELLAIRRAISRFSLRIDLRVEKAPISKEKAGRAIEETRPHLLHYIGHGDSENGGSLLLMDEKGNNQPWSRDEIRVVLSGLKREVPRVAVINACQSAGAAGILGYTSVAEAFAQIGCPALIAMRGDILGESASGFAKTFYQSLAEFGINRVDQAYCRALGAIASQAMDPGVWALPRIYFQESLEKVFPLTGECRGFDRAAAGFDDLEELKPFINQEDRRFEIYHQADCWLEADEPAHRVLLIHGPKGSGKSWLLRAIVYAASLRGLHAVYRNFGDKNLELEDFFKALLEGDPQGRFYLSGPLVTGKSQPGPFDELDAAQGQSSPSGNEDQKGPLVERFAKGLKKVAENQNLLIALDHIDQLQVCWRYLREPVFEAATRGSRPGGLGAGLRLVIAADPVELSKFDLLSLKTKAIELADLSPDTFEDYLVQFCLHRLEEGEGFFDRLAECREIIQLMAAKRKKDRRTWQLSSLNSLYDAIEGI